MAQIGAALMRTGAGVPAPVQPTPRRVVHGGAPAVRDDRGRRGLAGCFPVVRRLVGEDSFGLVMRRFADCESRDLGIGWRAFPRFLRSQGNGATFDYLADIAELELA